MLQASIAEFRSNKSHFFPVNVKDESGRAFTIDAANKGNLSRFVHKSDEPNAEVIAVKDEFCQKEKLVMKALREIKPFEEITIGKVKKKFEGFKGFSKESSETNLLNFKLS